MAKGLCFLLSASCDLVCMHAMEGGLVVLSACCVINRLGIHVAWLNVAVWHYNENLLCIYSVTKAFKVEV